LSSAILIYSYEFQTPDAWAAMPPQRRESRGELIDDLCHLDDHYYIKGNLWLPVIDGEQDFSWTVWAELSQSDYERSIALWDTAGRELEPVYPGELANELPGYRSSLGLKLQIVTMGVGERPSFVLEPADHQLVKDQRDRISMQRLNEFSKALANR
jgi:hypothetical protein